MGEELFETPEGTEAKLITLEQKLAERLGLTGDVGAIRAEIIRRIKSNELVEDELVSEWNSEYSSHLDWQQHKE